jgi:hypothetical protein
MRKIFLIISLMFSINLIAQIDNSFNLTGNLSADSKTLLSEYKSESPLNLNITKSESKKSPLLAGLFSVILPGAGEFYAESYYKSAAFFALEAALVTVAVVYNKKGDDKTKEFENYADNITDKSGWSVVRYAQWINQYKGKNIQINPNTNLNAWDRVNWTELNAVEREINGFSHTLARHGEQQYYEMIGKYHQFSPGWWDYSGGSNNFEISPSYAYYSGLRGNANDLYNISTKAVVGIYINHFLSALDAVWSAVSFNKDLAVSFRMDAIQVADNYDMYPAVYMKYNF